MSSDRSEIEALLFDLGGVVIAIDFSRVIDVWAQRSESRRSDIATRFTIDDAYRRHEIGLIDAPTYFESLRHTLGIDLSDDDFMDGWLAVHVGSVDGIEELLDSAAGTWPLYALTNTNAAHHDAGSVRFADVLDRFEAVFDSPSIGLRKPDPEVYEYAAARMGVAVDRILFFDDSRENVDGARACGMPSVLVSSIDDVRAALDAHSGDGTGPAGR